MGITIQNARGSDACRGETHCGPEHHTDTQGEYVVTTMSGSPPYTTQDIT